MQFQNTSLNSDQKRPEQTPGSFIQLQKNDRLMNFSTLATPRTPRGSYEGIGRLS